MIGLAFNLNQNAPAVVGTSPRGTCQLRKISFAAAFWCLRYALAEASKGIKRWTPVRMSSTTAHLNGGNAIWLRMMMYLQGGNDDRKGGAAFVQGGFMIAQGGSAVEKGGNRLLQGGNAGTSFTNAPGKGGIAPAQGGKQLLQ
jgi:hypothetical protein